jgi:hypothetical protein
MYFAAMEQVDRVATKYLDRLKAIQVATFCIENLEKKL